MQIGKNVLREDSEKAETFFSQLAKEYFDTEVLDCLTLLIESTTACGFKINLTELQARGFHFESADVDDAVFENPEVSVDHDDITLWYDVDVNDWCPDIDEDEPSDEEKYPEIHRLKKWQERTGQAKQAQIATKEEIDMLPDLE